jgi:hypothetical protein
MKKILEKKSRKKRLTNQHESQFVRPSTASNIDPKIFYNSSGT